MEGLQKGYKHLATPLKKETLVDRL